MPTNNSKQAFWVGVGSFFSFVVGIVSPMILSRYFSKGDYGTYKQVMFVYNTLLSVFTLGLPKAYAYFLPKYERRYSKDIIRKITSIFFVLGGIFSLTLFFGAEIIAKILNNVDLALALKVFAPTPLLLLPTLGLDGIFASFRRTQFSAIYTIITRIFTVVLTVLPVLLFDGTYIHAIIGFDIASLVACVLALLLKSWPFRKEESSVSDVTFKRIISFALPLFYASIWGMILGSANQFFISRYYGNEVFAEFSNGFMEIPFASMIISAIGTVLLPRFSEMDDGTGMQEGVYRLWLNALEKTSKIIFPILIYSVFFSRIIMTCLYGDMYSNSAIYFQIKNISSLLYIVPFAPIMLAIGKSKEYANAHLIAAVAIVILDYLCVLLLDSPIWIAIISEACQVLKILLMVNVIARYSKKKIHELFQAKTVLFVGLQCIIASALTYSLFASSTLDKFIILFASFVVFSVIYYSLSWLFRISYREIVLGLLPSLEKSKIINFIP